MTLRLPAPRRERGFSLIESIFATAISASLILTLTYTTQVTVGRGEAGQDVQEQLVEGETVIAELESAVRWADRIVQASAGLLTVEARHLVDTDDAMETIRYEVVGGNLTRQISQDGVNYQSPEILLRNVNYFKCASLMISDSFDSADYGGVVPEGDAPQVDGSVKTEYKLIEMGEVDADLKAHYDSDDEKIDVLNTSILGTTITVSPDLARTGLEAEIEFTPLAAGEYRPLIYGHSSLDEQGIGVVFASDLSVRLRVVVGGSVTDEAIGSFTWTPGETVKVHLSLEEKRATAWIKGSGGTQDVGTTTNGVTSIDDQPVHLQVLELNEGARFDDLELGYRQVIVKLGVDTDTGVIDFPGLATRRVQ